VQSRAVLRCTNAHILSRKLFAVLVSALFAKILMGDHCKFGLGTQEAVALLA
jgi:hypothetical protein